MKKLVIFAGTTEGRRLSEILADAGIAHTVCVATEYGEIVMREQTESTKAMQTAGQPIVNLHCGRMDREQMQKFLHDEGYEIVVDATHPYARVVTENLRGAVDTLKSLEKDAHFPIYLRLERKIDGITEADGIVTNVQYFENNADCAKALENTEGNILLTTGSKELAVYCASGRLKDRLHVRILPGRESLELCMEQGIKGRQILALQGPFSTEMNAAILRQYDIRHMVTKNSGRAGGCQEKLEAAKMLGIPVYVIESAQKTSDAAGNIPGTDSYSFAGICGKLGQLCDCKISQQGSLEICLAGIGMGSRDCMTKEVQQTIETADILLGAERMIADYSARIEKKPYYMAAQILPYLEKLQESEELAQQETLRVAVLFSGDTGFYSGSGSMMRELKARFGEVESSPYEVTVFPGISSVSALAARFGISWDDACLASAHGRDCDAAALLKEHEKVFLLLDSSMNLRQICQILKDADMGNTRIYAGVRMGYEDERKIYGTAEEMTDIETNSLTAVFLEREKDER